MFLLVVLIIFRIDVVPAIENVTVTVFAFVTLFWIPLCWFLREQTKYEYAEPERLPSRYRVMAYGVLAAAVAIFVAFMWYTISRGLTKLW